MAIDIGKLGAIQSLLGGAGVRGPAGSKLKQLLEELMGGTQASASASGAQAAARAGGAQASAQAGGAQASARAGGCPCCQGGCKGGACKCCGKGCSRCKKLRGN